MINGLVSRMRLVFHTVNVELNFGIVLHRLDKVLNRHIVQDFICCTQRRRGENPDTEQCSWQQQQHLVQDLEILRASTLDLYIRVEIHLDLGQYFTQEVDDVIRIF